MIHSPSAVNTEHTHACICSMHGQNQSNPDACMVFTRAKTAMNTSGLVTFWAFNFREQYQGAFRMLGYVRV